METEKETSSSEDTLAPSPKKKDTWDKIGILGRGFSAIAAAMVTLIAGCYGNIIMKRYSEQMDRRASIENDGRLYSQLMSQRESAESNLRKDMFSAILGAFLLSSTNESANIENKLLELELLSLNFHDSMLFTPLYEQLLRDIEQSPSTAAKKQEQRKRLTRASRKVILTQENLLADRGNAFVMPFYYLEDQGFFSEDFYDANYAELLTNHTRMAIPTTTTITFENTGTLNTVKRDFLIKFYDINVSNQSIQVYLNIKSTNLLDSSDLPDSLARTSNNRLKESPARFELNFFDFPLVSNTVLSQDERFALLMNTFKIDDNVETAGPSIYRIVITGMYFPGELSSLRHKQYYSDIYRMLMAKHRK